MDVKETSAGWRTSRPVRFIILIIVNGVLLLALFAIAEICQRILTDGFPEAFTKMVRSWQTPYSNLGTSNWVVYDEELGYRLNPARPGINSLSIRSPEIAVPKPENLFRILFLGDSVPWDKPGMVSRMRDTFREAAGYEIINAAVPGYTSYQEMLFYSKYLSRTEPDLVIWTYCLNDNHRFLHRFDGSASLLMTDEAKRSLEINSVWDEIVSRSYILSSLKLHLMSRQSRSNGAKSPYPWENAVDFNTAWKDYSWNDYERHLVKLKAILDRQGSRLAIVVFPFEPQLLLGSDNKDLEYVVKPQRKLAALCRRHNVPFLDLYPIFKPGYLKQGKLYRDWIHLNQEGHKLAADAIISFLRTNGLLHDPAVKPAPHNGLLLSPGPKE